LQSESKAKSESVAKKESKGESEAKHVPDMQSMSDEGNLLEMQEPQGRKTAEIRKDLEEKSESDVKKAGGELKTEPEPHTKAKSTPESDKGAVAKRHSEVVDRKEIQSKTSSQGKQETQSEPAEVVEESRHASESAGVGSAAELIASNRYIRRR
jgi:hypothetical protein